MFKIWQSHYLKGRKCVVKRRQKKTERQKIYYVIKENCDVINNIANPTVNPISAKPDGTGKTHHTYTAAPAPLAESFNNFKTTSGVRSWTKLYAGAHTGPLSVIIFSYSSFFPLILYNFSRQRFFQSKSQTNYSNWIFIYI